MGLNFTKNVYPRATIGEYTYGQPVVLWWGEDTSLTIGKFCSIAANVQIYIGGNHHTEWVSTYPLAALYSSSSEKESTAKGNVVIGHDVWIGNNATILSGVTIGNGAIIGACAVVSKDVPAYAVVAGNPAMVKKYRLSCAQIKALETIAWWNLSEDKIKDNIPLLLSGNVNAFIQLHTIQKGT